MTDFLMFAKRWMGGVSRAFQAAWPILATAAGIVAHVFLAVINGLLLVVVFVALVFDVYTLLGPTETTYSNALVMWLSVPFGVWVCVVMIERFIARILNIRKGGSRVRDLLGGFRRDTASDSVG